MSYNKYLIKVNIESNQACLWRCETKEGKKNLLLCCIVLIDEEKNISNKKKNPYNLCIVLRTNRPEQTSTH